MNYAKPPLSHAQQVAVLSARGLDVGSIDDAVHALQRIGYYRLSGYWYPFRAAGDGFETGTRFDTALMLYEFDRRLRLIVMDAIERVEIAVRSAVIYELAHAYGTFAHIDAANFWPGFAHAAWFDQVETEARRSREDFIAHFKSRYQGFPRLPIWMALEVISLGALSRLFSGMRKSVQRRIARPYGLEPIVLTSWLHTLTFVRNVCAHHARLWNRILGIPPKRPRRDPRWATSGIPKNDRLWVVLLLLRHLMAHHHEGNDWQDSVVNLVTPLVAEPRWRQAMGFPVNWATQALWTPGNGAC